MLRMEGPHGRATAPPLQLGAPRQPEYMLPGTMCPSLQDKANPAKRRACPGLGAKGPVHEVPGTRQVIKSSNAVNQHDFAPGRFKVFKATGQIAPFQMERLAGVHSGRRV
jgi:hypothetical protein